MTHSRYPATDKAGSGVSDYRTSGELRKQRCAMEVPSNCAHILASGLRLDPRSKPKPL